MPFNHQRDNKLGKIHFPKFKSELIASQRALRSSPGGEIGFSFSKKRRKDWHSSHFPQQLNWIP